MSVYSGGATTGTSYLAPDKIYIGDSSVNNDELEAAARLQNFCIFEGTPPLLNLLYNSGVPVEDPSSLGALVDFWKLGNEPQFHATLTGKPILKDTVIVGSGGNNTNLTCSNSIISLQEGTLSDDPPLVKELAATTYGEVVSSIEAFSESGTVLFAAS